MRLPMLKEFLCGMSVRTGSLIIGWLFMLRSIFVSICLIAVVAKFSQLTGTEQKEFFQSLLAESSKGHYLSHDTLSEENYQTALDVTKCVLAIAGVITVIQFLIDLSLLIGIYRKNNCMMLPWLFLQGFCCVIIFIAMGLWFLLLLGQMLTTEMTGQRFFQALQVSVSLLVNAIVSSYFYLVVYTFHRSAKMEKKDMNYIKM